MDRNHNWRHGRFEQGEEDPLGAMTNLVDIMLVFICGLVVALLATHGGVREHFAGRKGGTAVEKGRELPPTPAGQAGAGTGMTPVGQVYRDPKTGKLIMVSE
jgi:hypothetical protein